MFYMNWNCAAFPLTLNIKSVVIFIMKSNKLFPACGSDLLFNGYENKYMSAPRI